VNGDDHTLGGYLAVHQRPPAFGAADGQAYTVSTLVDDAPDEHGHFGAALLFVRWSGEGDRPVGHLETAYLAHGPTPQAAQAPLLALSLADVKAHLDRCIAQRPVRDPAGDDSC
jgi:hypothetical protein